jgi:hypothetical protein
MWWVGSDCVMLCLEHMVVVLCSHLGLALIICVMFAAQQQCAQCT